MKIKLLGTGASEGIPAFRCQCATCSEARAKGGKFVRQNVAAYIEGDHGEKILLDLPSSIKMMLNHAKVEEDALQAIFITHSDFDHIGGLFNLQQNNNQQGFKGNYKIETFMPTEMIQSIEKRMDLTEFEHNGLLLKKQYGFSLQSIQAYQQVQIGNLGVQALESNHLNLHSQEPRDCFGYLIKQKGEKGIAYFPDAFIEMPEKTFDILHREPLDYLFIDCTFASSKAFPICNHLDIQDLVAVHERIAPRNTFAIHISHRNLGHEALLHALKQHGIGVAYDGMEIEV